MAEAKGLRPVFPAIGRVFCILGLLAGLYVGTYAVLSWNGSYVASQTGMAKIANGGPSINDASVWRPKFVRLRIFLNEEGRIVREANFLGWVFYPLELLDRQYWHPSKRPFLDLLNGMPPLLTPGR